MSDARAKVQTRSFVGHNILLDDGTQTLPSIGRTMDQHPVVLSTKRVLASLYPDGLRGRTLIDLGCLEGGFTTEFARAGIDATGVEVRESNFANCLYVREHVNLPNLRFVQGDANDVDRFGPFDVFFVSGLLYHLDTPRKFLEAVARNCRKALILWTHVSHVYRNEAARHFSLSPLVENEGLHGRWYPEYDGISRSQLDALKWASWSNPKSFWIQKEYLLVLLRNAGFDLLLEQFDWMEDIVGDMTEGQHRKLDRVMLVAVKTGVPPARERRAYPHPPLQEIDDVYELAREARELRTEVESLRASSSWRITAPLRSIASMLKGTR